MTRALTTRVVLTGLLLSAVIPHLSNAQVATLSNDERQTLRAHLERIFFEQDMLIRNQKVDRSDIKHQEREFEQLRVFERIPFVDDLAGLRESVTASARERGLRIERFRNLPKPKKKIAPIPSTLITDVSPPFRLSDDQIAEQVPFEATLRGKRADIDAWIRSWPQDQLRLARMDRVISRGPKGSDLWAVQAHAFRFREVKFPTLEPHDPLEILPLWARRDPNRFSELEPVLWNYVQRTHAISAQARPLYRTREQMLLNAARSSFFVSLAVPPMDYNQGHAARRSGHPGG